MNKIDWNYKIKDLQKNFLIGILSLIPLSVGLWVVSLLYQYISLIVKFFYGHNLNIGVSLSIILVTFGTIAFIGNKIINMEKIFLFSSLEQQILTIPFIGFVVKTVKEIVKLFTDNSKDNYLGVVKVPFNNAKTLGLITNINKNNNEEIYTVFIPTAPNPTSGFVLFYDKSQIEKTDISVHDVFKIQISLGVSSK